MACSNVSFNDYGIRYVCLYCRGIFRDVDAFAAHIDSNRRAAQPKPESDSRPDLPPDASNEADGAKPGPAARK